MSRIHVLKFGGSSLASHDLLVECAQLVTRRIEAGDQVVVVVSAMGSTTDELLSLGRSLGIAENSTTHDLLLSSGEHISAVAMSSALNRMGHDSVPLTGGEAGLLTNGRHGGSDLIEVNPDRVVHELRHGRTPVVMGFQGIGPRGTLTLLGRGGSDTTAVALAGALRTPGDSILCELHTDVDGVHTSDPRLVPHTTKLESIGCQTMQALARLGARVVAHKAVRHAECEHVPVRVVSAFSPGIGTLISSEFDPSTRSGVLACALSENLGRITLECRNASPELISGFLEVISNSPAVFEQLEHTQSIQTNCIQWTASASVIDVLASELSRRMAGTPSRNAEMTIERSLARIAIVGRDLTRYSAMLNRCRSSVASTGTVISSWSLDDLQCTFFVPSEDAHTALRTTHRALGLESTPDDHQ